MIVTFCGHSDFVVNEKYEQKIMALFEKKIAGETVDFYLGGYGGFDDFVYRCAKKYKRKNPNASLVFVTPYLTADYQKNHLIDSKEKYDFIIYPEIENKPKRFAITYRNRFMVDNADIVIVYIEHDWGGAYKTYKYAKSKGKLVINLSERDID